jgi:hypothetical protein
MLNKNKQWYHPYQKKVCLRLHQLTPNIQVTMVSQKISLREIKMHKKIRESIWCRSSDSVNEEISKLF